MKYKILKINHCSSCGNFLTNPLVSFYKYDVVVNRLLFHFSFIRNCFGFLHFGTLPKHISFVQNILAKKQYFSQISILAIFQFLLFR